MYGAIQIGLSVKHPPVGGVKFTLTLVSGIFVLQNKTKYFRLRLSYTKIGQRAIKRDLRETWARMMKIESSWQTWTKRTDSRTKWLLELLMEPNKIHSKKLERFFWSFNFDDMIHWFSTIASGVPMSLLLVSLATTACCVSPGWDQNWTSQGGHNLTLSAQFTNVLMLWL